MRSLFILLFACCFFSSCVPKKDILYLQDIPHSSSTELTSLSTTIKVDDLLRIVVTSENMQSVESFNQYIAPVLPNATVAVGQPQLFAYLVDDQGAIEFPLIGNITLKGLKINEAIKVIKDEIAKYVLDPVNVDVRILNYKITILGEVNSPGTFNMESNRVTLLQALGYAKDLTIYGDRKTVVVIREVDGKQVSRVIDLTSNDFTKDDFYYIQQNDVIVVNPNNAQIQSAGFNRNAPLFVSIASLLLSIILIISRN